MSNIQHIQYVLNMYSMHMYIIICIIIYTYIHKLDRKTSLRVLFSDTVHI